jgi:hypothetical protein
MAHGMIGGIGIFWWCNAFGGQQKCESLQFEFFEKLIAEKLLRCIALFFKLDMSGELKM